MNKMPKFKHIVRDVPIDLGYGSDDRFTIAELKERIMSRQSTVFSADPIDMDTVRIELEHDYDRDSCSVLLNVILTQTLTVEKQEELWLEQQRNDAEWNKKAMAAGQEHERREYERLKKKFEGGKSPK
jgi:hypothetical protein